MEYSQILLVEKGFLLLDSNLNLIKDNRIDNLTSNIVCVILSDEKLYIFSQKEVNLLTGSAQDVKYYETQINEVLLPNEILSNYKEEIITSKDDIFIFPNTATEYITINLKTSEVLETSEVSRVEIYDVMGMKIQTTPSASQPPLNEGNLKIDISNFAHGVYFVKINGSNGACSIVEKFVKY